MESRYGEGQDARARSRCRKWLRRTVCGLHGHDLLLSFEPDRVCLRCSSCSYETAGWLLTDRDTRPRPQRRHSAVLVEENAR
jgi:hypothetical protein